MRYMNLLILSTIVATVIALGGYASRHAQAQATPPPDAGLVTPDGGLDEGGLQDLSDSPSAALVTVKDFWNKGAFQGVVLVCMLVAAAVHKRTEPTDGDGDGLPDIDAGWRCRTWVMTGAALMVGVPLLAVLTHTLGATWGAVAIGAVVSAGYAMHNLNPKKGSKYVPPGRLA